MAFRGSSFETTMSWKAHLTVLTICLVLLGLVSAKWTDFRGVLGNILAAVLFVGIEGLIRNWGRFAFNIQAWRIQRDELVRVSVSHLIRIRIDGKTLLVRGHRIASQFQPVGGVYKYFPSAIAIMQELGIRDDGSMPIDDTSKHDLRLRVPARNLVKFRAWFESERSREIGPWREFYEEMLEPGLLPQEAFPHARFEFLKRHAEPIAFSIHFNCMEWLVADIFDLCPTAEQERALRDLLTSTRSDILWADDQMIRSRGVVPPARMIADIARTAEWM
jgi:hypothetical protein